MCRTTKKSISDDVPSRRSADPLTVYREAAVTIRSGMLV